MTSASTQPPPFTSQLGAAARDIKLSHTVFALPFALLATFLAADWVGRSLHFIDFLVIVLCMVAARSFAMMFNRWADAKIDAANPRTQGRAVPSGQVDLKMMRSFALVAALCLPAATLYFLIAYDNPWPLILSPLVLIVLGGYSYTKRFTWLCHAVLGLALAISPLAATIAIAPGYLGSSEVWLLALMVLCWVAGFDVLYALQDTEVDRELGLHSLPSRLGVGPALWISRALHVLSAAALIGVATLSEQLRLFFAIATGLTCTLLVVEHALVWGGKTKQLNMAFFTVNGVISVLLGAAGIIDLFTTS